MRMRIPSLYVTTRNYIQCYHDWCKSCDKVRYRKRVPRTGLCMRHGCCRAWNSVRTLSLRTFDRRCKCKDQFKVFSVYSLPVVEFML